MKHDDYDERSKVLCLLNALPRKILGLQGQENLTEFVLHDLAGADCFNLHRAAYFVDNPDFDCIKGIAGFNRQEIEGLPSDVWQDADRFSERMRSSVFNQRVRKLERPSFRRIGSTDEEIARELAEGIEMPHYHFCSWDTKHNNHGFLVYEPVEEEKHRTLTSFYVKDAACLLGLCPIF